MTECKKTTAVIAEQSVVKLPIQSSNLVKHGLAALETQQGLSKDEDKLNAESQYQRGKKYYIGDGIPQDYEEAMKWYMLAADQGSPRAQKALEELDIDWENNAPRRTRALPSRWEMARWRVH